MTVITTVALIACWATVALVWVAGALQNAVHAPPEPIRGEVDTATSIAAVLAAAFVLLVTRRYAEGLSIDAVWVQIVGLGVLIASTAFAVWARVSLGTSWSVGPRIGGDRRLRTRGPYAITRHPIYTGLLGMLLGTTMLGGFGQWIGLVAIGLIGVEAKIRMEERLLLATYPDEYRRYRRAVPQLIPGLRLPRGRDQ
jgi:protein-S-isoprenylcysteine O-methyltransferase Ste14